MNKVVVSLLVLVTSVFSTQAQNESYGIKAGYSSLVLRVSVDGTSASEDVSGFYLGFFAEFGISEDFAIQPELQYASYSEDGESSDVLILPVLAKYKANDKFSLLAGPQFDYLLNEDDAQGFNRLGIGIALGASFDFTENVVLDARYTFGISNRIDDESVFGLDPVIANLDIETRFNYFQIGLGYRF